MKKLLFIFASLLIVSQVSAQQIDFNWGFGFGSSSNDYGEEVLTDQAGNVILIGTFRNSIDVNPLGQASMIQTIGPSNTSFNTYIAKYDKSGSLIWVKQFTGANLASAATIDDQDNLYITGIFSSTIDLDPDSLTSFTLTRTGSSSNNTYIAKLDPNGNFIFGKQITSENSNDIALDQDKNIYLAGSFSLPVDFDPSAAIFTVFPVGSRDGYTCKLDSLGNFEWVRQVGGSAIDEVNGITISQTNEVLVCGTYSDQADFGTATNPMPMATVGSLDLFIANYSDTGAVNWVKTTGGSSVDRANAIVTDHANNIYVTGSFIDTVDFGFGSTSTQLTTNEGPWVSDAYILKFDSAANFSFVKHLKGTGSQVGSAIYINQTGDIISGGLFSGSVSMNPNNFMDTLFAQSSEDVYINSLTSSGAYNWSHQIASSGSNRLFSIAEDNDEGLYFTGYVRGNADFNPSGTSAPYNAIGGNDAYLVKLLPCRVVTQIDTINSCQSSYTWPANNTSYSMNGTYTHILSTSLGCDSVLQLILSLNSNSGPDTMVNVCDSYFWPKSGLSYSSSGVYYDTLMNSLGCDSVLSLTLSINNSTYDTLTVSACNSYVSPSGKMFTSSTVFSDTLPNSIGCDSILNINLSVFGPTTSSLNLTSCDSLIAPSGRVFYSNGLYRDTIMNTNGCDSLITFFLTLQNSTTDFDSVIACNDFILPNMQKVTSTGTYPSTFTGANGCDSTINTYVVIDVIDTSITRIGNQLIANQNGLSYQWLDCNNGFAPIPNESNQSFMATVSGSYAVETSNGNCSDTSNCQTVIVTSISEKEAIASSVNVYPNPFQNQFIIQNKRQENLVIELYSYEGKLIQSLTTNKEFSEINVEGASGLYLVKIDGEYTHQSMTLFKQ